MHGESGGRARRRGYLAISAGTSNTRAGKAGQQLEVSWKAPSDRKIGYRMAGDELFLTMEDAKEAKFKRQGAQAALSWATARARFSAAKAGWWTAGKT